MTYKLYEDNRLIGQYESKVQAQRIMFGLAEEHILQKRYADRYQVDIIQKEDTVEFKPVGQIIRQLFDEANKQDMSKFYFPDFRIEHEWSPYLVKTFTFNTTGELNVFLTGEQINSSDIISISNNTLYYKVESL